MTSIDLDSFQTRSPLSVARRIFGILLRAIGLIVTMALAVGTGVWTSRTMVARGSLLSVSTYGPWVEWREAGLESADPYTRAHFATTGKIRIASNSAGIFEARVDSTGARLHSSCDYIIEGPALAGLWWSIAVFDAGGRLIANDASRYAFTSDTAALNPNGTFLVTLGRDARPGNWIPTGGAGRLVLVFTVLDPANGLSAEQRANRTRLLPAVRRESCS